MSKLAHRLRQKFNRLNAANSNLSGLAIYAGFGALWTGAAVITGGLTAMASGVAATVCGLGFTASLFGNIKDRMSNDLTQIDGQTTVGGTTAQIKALNHIRAELHRESKIRRQTRNPRALKDSFKTTAALKQRRADILTSRNMYINGDTAHTVSQKHQTI